MTSFEPRVITKSDPVRVSIDWADGHKTVYPARTLRQLCPCAGCIEEHTGRALLDPESVPTDIVTRDVALVGNYAISVLFSDGHSTGIYPFRMLRENDAEG
ncbi:MAG: DUF971 domain-containing protein [Planctomycetota bacterium]